MPLRLPDSRQGLPKGGPPGSTIWVKVRAFSQPDNPVPKPIPLVLVVKCGTVERAAVVPDSWRREGIG